MRVDGGHRRIASSQATYKRKEAEADDKKKGIQSIHLSLSSSSLSRSDILITRSPPLPSPVLNMLKAFIVGWSCGVG